MSNERKIWIVSDTHFNHEQIKTKFWFRPEWFEDIIIKKIKNNVKEHDILIHLWDVIFDRPSELSDYLSKMWNSTKILVRWNHDKNNVWFYLNKWFDFVMDEFKLIDYHGFNIIFSHIPIRELPDGFINIHWHLHNHRNILSFTDKPERYFCYSWEDENFQPLLLTTILKNFNKI
jgi:calcineurin-like phosphoesterase family protein